MSLESPAALAASSKQPQHRPGQDSFRVSNPSILISRATRGKQLKAALDRDVANSKELRHLDEFLGSQVRAGWRLFNSQTIKKDQLDNSIEWFEYLFITHYN